jgi:hypothetical protein
LKPKHTHAAYQRISNSFATARELPAEYIVTTQSLVALESGKHAPSMRNGERYAHAPSTLGVEQLEKY